MASVISHLFKSAQKQLTEWKVEPYLHFEPNRVYNPLTDRSFPITDAAFGEARAFLDGQTSFKRLPPPLQERLISEEWVIAPDKATDDRFLIKFVSLEANIACNQSCYFCPVSVTRRTDNVMSLEQYEQIVEQLVAYKETLQVVFMNHYNEPTVDKYFVDRVRILKKHGLQPALLTNGSGLTPRRIDALVEMGGIRFLSVNLSTIDRERYVKERGQDQVDIILRNLDYAKDKVLAEDMGVIVLGLEDENHKRDLKEISERFAGTNFKVTSYPVDSRSQFFDFGDMPIEPIKRLRGCEQTGSRPLQHLHVTGEAKAILCCQDYHSEYVVGDLNTQTVEQVLKGAEMGLMRRWVYGLEEAPEKFHVPPLHVRIDSMKVVYVLDQPELGGGVKVVFQHAQLLAEQGYSVMVMAGAPKPDWAPFRGEYLNYNASAPRLESGDVIIATYWTTIPFIQSLGCQPTIHFCQGYEGDLIHLAPMLPQIEAIYRLPLPTFVVTPALGEVIRQRFRRESFVVSPPLDPMFRPLILRRSPQRTPWIVIPGIFEAEVKGVRTALGTVKRLREMGQECRVLRISILPLSDEEKAILSPDRYLCGVDPHEFAHILRRCDLLLFPSLPAEGFGLPVVEAMASKVPVVASRIPSVEYIGNPVIVPVGDVEAFAIEARRLLTDAAHWQQTRRIGYEAAQKFRPEAITRQLVQGLEWANARAS